MNLQMLPLSAGKQRRTANRTFASRLFSSTLFYSCCLLVAFLVTAGFGYYKKWWASTYVNGSTGSFPAISFIGRVVTGDFDKDGDDDILYQAGVDGAPIMFAASNGNGTFASAVPQSASPFRNVAAFNINNAWSHVKDFDNDGDDDVYFTIGGGQGTYLRNDNGVYSSQMNGTFPVPQFPGRVLSGDFDGDGDVDLIYQTGVDGSPFFYARNDGSVTFTQLPKASSPFAGVSMELNNATMIVADFDKDGDLDIWSPVGNSTGRYYQNNGVTWSEPFSANFPGPQFPARVKVADYDNDGDPDILYQTGVDGSPFGYYQNNGNATFTNTGIAGSPLNGLTLPNLTGINYNIVDFDNDDDIDIYTTANSTQGSYFVQHVPQNAGPWIHFAPGAHDVNVTEDQAKPIAGISFSDPDAGSATVTVSFTAPSGTWNAVSANGVTVSGSGSDSIALNGSVAAINAFMGNQAVSYVPALNASGDVLGLVYINDNGNTGSGGAKIARAALSLHIRAVNDQPNVTLPASVGVSEDEATALTGISFTDVDAGNAAVDLMLIASSGTLTATSGGGVTVSVSGTSTLSLTGSITNINAFIAAGNISYTTTPNATANETLSGHINDLGNTGSGGALTRTFTTILRVLAVNDAPVITVPGAQQTDMNTNLVFNATNSNQISISDPDVTNPAVTELQVSLSVTNGVISLGSITGLTFIVGDGTADTDITFKGSLNNLNAALANLVYTPNHNFTSSDRLNINLSDLGNTGSGNILTTNSYVDITVNATYAVIRTVQSTNPDGTYTPGDQVNVTVTFSRPVVVNTAGGTPSLLLETGTTDRPAVYISGSGTSTLTFRYTVQSGDNTPDLDYTSTTALTLNGGSIKNTSNDDAILTLPAVGGPNSLGGQHNIVILNATPSITSVTVPAPGTYGAGQPLDFTVNFTEPVVVNTSGGSPYLDLIVGATNVRATYTGGTGTNALTFRYVVQNGNADADGVNLGALLELNGSTIQDIDGNNSDVVLVNIGPTQAVKVDGVAPTVVLSTTATSPVNGSFSITITFSEAVTGLTMGDFSTTNAGLSGLSSTNAYTYTVTVTPLADGQVTISVPAGGVQDLAGNNNAGSNTLTLNYDGTAPVIAISSPSPNIVNVPFTVTFTFSEAMNGFAASDITVANATVSNFATVDAQTYTAVITPSSNGNVTVSVPANIATDGAGNNNTASNTLTRTYDGGKPSVVISTTAVSPVNQPFTIRLDFSEPVIGFAATDLTVTNGTASNLQTTDNITWTALITPTADGRVTVQLPAATVKDAAGNDNTASLQLTITYDNAVPTVTLIKTIGNATNAPFTITIQFSEVVNGFAIADLSLTNATAGNLQTTDNKTYTALITPGVYGPLTVTVPASVVIDAAGNSNTASNTLGVVYDNTKPVVVVTSAVTDPVSGPFTVTFTFSEAVNGFAVSDITVTNGTASNFVTINAQTYTALITPASSGPVSVSVPANMATDAAGNNNTASNTLSRRYDDAAPSISITTTAVSPVNQPFSIQLAFSEAVTGLTTGDLNIVNGTASNLQTTDNITYTALITPTADGPVTVQLPAGKVIDAAGNANTISNLLNISYDGTAPTVTLSKTIGNATNAPFTITIQFSEVVSGFAIADLALTNATASNLQTTDNKTYTALITPGVDGPVTASVAAGIATDQATNPNTASNTLSVVYDNTRPAVAITTTAADPVKGPFTIQIAFSEAITGLTASDLTIGNGTASNLQTTDNRSWTALITPAADGPVTVQLPAATAVDGAGNANTASNQLILTYDGTAPTVTLSKTVGTATNAPFTVTIRFSEVVNGFALSDLALTNATPSNLQTTDNKNFTALITPVSEGAVTVNVPAGVATDQATNPNTAASALSVLYDVTRPTAAISSTAPDPVKAPFSITITFNEIANGFAANDLAMVNGSVSDLQTNNNRTFTATVTPAGEGVVSVTVKAGGATDVAGNSNTASATLSRRFDISPPVITLTPRNVRSATVAAPFTVEFRSNEKINGLTLAEIAVTNGVASNLVRESEFVYTATITPQFSHELVTVQLPAGSVEDLAGNLNAQSNKLSLMVLNTARVVNVYPVPTRGPLTIQFDGIPARKTKIMIMDMVGRILLTREYEMTSKQLQLNISGIIPGGMYQLVVNNDGNVDRRNIVISL